MADPQQNYKSNEDTIGASRSLKKICNGKDDIVGFIAYGIFKFEQSEWAIDSKPSREDVDKHHQTLQASRIESLRSNAEDRLTDWIASIEDDWRKAMFDEIRDSVADAVAKEIERKVTERLSVDVSAIRKSTSFRTAILANITGWLITIGLTAIILINTVLPSLTNILAATIQRNDTSTNSVNSDMQNKK